MLAGTMPCAAQQGESSQPVFVSADHIFDGNDIRHGSAVLIENGLVKAIDTVDSLRAAGQREIRLGDATLLPGIIEMHAHLFAHGIPPDIVLQHGVTTLRDLGGPIPDSNTAAGMPRILTAGPILTASGGYPLSFGWTRTIRNPDAAVQTVRELAGRGVNLIKVALEPGGEPDAPWSSHAHGGDSSGHEHGATHAPGHWPLLSVKIVRAIVEEAHMNGLKVSAHVGEATGVKIALDAGVDEWAHVPCMPVADELLERAAQQQVIVVTTLDTLSACPGILENARRLVERGATLLYGSEIAHNDVPWGINAEELNQMQAAGMTSLQVLRAATSMSGNQLGLTMLGTLAPGAPADLIAVPGDVMKDFKPLEYPALVISGGTVIVNRFESGPLAPE